MYLARIFAAVAVLAAITFVVAQDPAYQPPQPPRQPQQQPGNEPEILTRGPIHEAFAVAISTEATAGPIVRKQPPEPLEEVPPPQKPEGEDVQWIPGYWFWDDERNDFIWVSGAWRVPPVDHQWVPGAWHQIGGQWQWTSGFWIASDTSSIEYLPDPPPEPETTPAVQSPGEGYVYAPGIWVYQENRYRWRPGYWVQQHPRWVFICAHYVWTPIGCIFVEGYWDHPLDDRGLLFAPAYIPPALYAQRGYVYHPSYALYDTALLGSLFVRTGYNMYYFGDYFDRRYLSAGYRPWIDYRIGTAIDPNWAYYRTYYGAQDRNWVNNMTALYQGRMRGEIPRPARTFAEQANVIARAGTATTGNAEFLHLAAPLQSVDQNVVRLTQVNQADQQRFTASARQLRQVGDQRVRLEAQSAQGGRRQQNQPVQLNLPASPVRSAVGDQRPGARPQDRPDQKQKDVQPRPVTPKDTRPDPKGPPPPDRPDTKQKSPPPPDRPTTPPTKGAPDRPTTPPTKGAPDRPTTPPTKGAPDRPTTPPPAKKADPTPPKSPPPPVSKSDPPRPTGPPPRPAQGQRPTVPERPKAPPPQDKAKAPPPQEKAKAPPPAPKKDKDKDKKG